MDRRIIHKNYKNNIKHTKHSFQNGAILNGV